MEAQILSVNQKLLDTIFLQNSTRSDVRWIKNFFIRLIMQTSFVYILLCSDKTYYTGVTENVYKRFDEHQDGKYFGSYTFSRRPLQLVYFCQFMDIEQAIIFEKRIKKWSQAKKLALIEGRYEDLPNLAKKNFGR